MEDHGQDPAGLRKAFGLLSFALFLACIGSAVSAAESPIARVEFRRCHENPPPLTKFDGLHHHAELHLGPDPRDCTLVVMARDASAELRVEQRFEANFSISNEGAHLDLRGWKTGYSHWLGLGIIRSGGSVQTLKDDNVEWDGPQVTTNELREKVRGISPAYAQLIKSVDDSPVMYITSRISFRISMKRDGKWVVVQVIDYDTPMGC